MIDRFLSISDQAGYDDIGDGADDDLMRDINAAPAPYNPDDDDDEEDDDDSDNDGDDAAGR